MKHECIDKLAKLLDEADIPYERNSLWDGEQIYVGELCDAVCHKYSCGYDEDLLEIMGALTEEEDQRDWVKGWLTPEEVAKRFIYCYKNNTSIYRKEE